MPHDLPPLYPYLYQTPRWTVVSVSRMYALGSLAHSLEIFLGLRLVGRMDRRVKQWAVDEPRLGLKPILRKE